MLRKAYTLPTFPPRTTLKTPVTAFHCLTHTCTHTQLQNTMTVRIYGRTSGELGVQTTDHIRIPYFPIVVHPKYVYIRHCAARDIFHSHLYGPAIADMLFIKCIVSGRGR